MVTDAERGKVSSLWSLVYLIEYEACFFFNDSITKVSVAASVAKCWQISWMSKETLISLSASVCVMHFALKMWFGGTLNKLIFIITTIIE